MRYYGAIKTVGKSAHKDDYKCAREKSVVAGSNCIQRVLYREEWGMLKESSMASQKYYPIWY